jgi:hypothetical protein
VSKRKSRLAWSGPDLEYRVAGSQTGDLDQPVEQFIRILGASVW